MIQNVFQSRWYALLVLIGAAASGFLWYIDAGSDWLLLLIGGLPLLLLYLFRQKNPVPNLLTLFFSVFLLTAVVGVWAAYRPEAALAKFWVLLGSVLIFYALAAQPFYNLPAVFMGFSLVGLALAFYLLLTHDWIAVPSDIDILNQIGLAWTELRPTLDLSLPSENIADGILAVMVFFPLAVALHAGRRRRLGRFLLGLTIALIIFAALFLTSSPSAWGALAIGLAVWIWWPLSRRLYRAPGTSAAQLFQRSLLLAGLAGVILVILFPNQIFALAHNLPGESSAISRAGLYTNAVKLVPDFWLTGGGLQSFAGLYSHYILGIPNLFFEYGHNLYLDVAIEQGLVGLAALAGIFFFSFFWLLRGFFALPRRSHTRRIFLPAIFSALVVMLVHGMLDNPFYGETATPLLFVLPGLAISVTNSRHPSRTEAFSLSAIVRRIPGARYWISGALVLLFGLLLTFFNPLAASVLANYSAVEMARIELADFPRDAWVDLEQAEKLAPVEPHLQRSLWYNPTQRSANYRMGLITMDRREYEQAANYLLTAYTDDPAHRGIRKALGYTYVWLGKFEQAQDKLVSLPEASQEMHAYVFWWQQQGRPDLAQNAERMMGMLTDKGYQ